MCSTRFSGTTTAKVCRRVASRSTSCSTRRRLKRTRFDFVASILADRVCWPGLTEQMPRDFVHRKVDIVVWQFSRHGGGQRGRISPSQDPERAGRGDYRDVLEFAGNDSGLELRCEPDQKSFFFLLVPICLFGRAADRADRRKSSTGRIGSEVT